MQELLEKLPIATPRPDRVLDFSAPLNPLYEKELHALAAHPAMAEFLTGSVLSEAMWRRLTSLLTPCLEWKNAEPDKAYEKIEPAILKQWLTDGSLEELRRRIDEDLTIARELTAYHSLIKLTLFQQYLLEFLNNYVSLGALFNPRAASMLQTGKLVMNGRHYTFATPVKNLAEHKRIATMSDICVLYVEATTGG